MCLQQKAEWACWCSFFLRGVYDRKVKTDGHKGDLFLFFRAVSSSLFFIPPLTFSYKLCIFPCLSILIKQEAGDELSLEQPTVTD